MDIPVYSIAGQVVDHVTVDTAALGGKPNMALLRQALVMYEANKRVGTAKVKTRSTVSGSGKKPWAQKHTGRARHGSRYSPIWVGGAVAHGPQPRDHRQRMPRTARRRALSSAFLAKAADGEVLAIDALDLPEAKTKAMAAVLKNVGATRTCLIVVPEHDTELWRCTRNIPGAAMLTYRELNAYDMIRPQRVVFARPALEQFLNQQAEKPVATDSAPEQVGV